jgi:hypothetical protein
LDIIVSIFYEQIFELGGVNYAADCGKKEAGLGPSFLIRLILFAET